MPFKNQMMKNNYHTHMYLCRHAVGDVEDYVVEAIKLKFTSLGMSDHGPFEELKDRSVRMKPADFELYLKKCDTAIEKYKSKIKIYKGLEIEYFENYQEMYQNHLSKLDYLALGQHYIKDEKALNGLRSCYTLSTTSHLETYANTLIEGMKTGYFKFVCHPDLMLYNINHFDETVKAISRKIIEEAVRLKIPLEINSNGIKKGLRTFEDGKRYLYPRLEFWELVKEMKALVIISSDAHDPKHLYDEDVLKAYDFASSLELVVEEALKF
ncbi:MAG: PHP domain-containing protein [Firmicutes bacterium]|nr:PHP domain-containing protein [Bacillota bacterium]